MKEPELLIEIPSPHCPISAFVEQDDRGCILLSLQ